MFLSESSIDDLMRSTFNQILHNSSKINVSKGTTYEIRGVLLELKDPRARLSLTERKGTIFSCLGELIWYLSGSNKLDFIKYYIQIYDKFSDDGETLYGAYGPRLFGESNSAQISNVFSILKSKKTTRQAVVQIFDYKDILEPHKDIPCTCTLQFFIRDGKLDLYTSMRSNDAYKGLPHDIFSFTMIQEIMARKLSVELGTYRHFVGSLHIYESDLENINTYIDEAWQEYHSMPSMPDGDPEPYISVLLEAEQTIRTGGKLHLHKEKLPSYWEDIVTILEIFKASKIKNKKSALSKIEKLKEEINHPIYQMFVLKQILRKAE